MSEKDLEPAGEGIAEMERMLASSLGEPPPPADLARWSRRARGAARPLLAASARREYRGRLAAALAAACLPLPLIAAYARTLLGWMHDALAFVLPAPLPDVAVASYAAVAVLLVSATYAALPVLVEITMRTPRVVHGE